MDNKPQVSSEKFYESFCAGFKDKATQEVLKETYHDNSSWTLFMTTLLHGLGKKLNFHVDFEFWPRTDIAYFDNYTPDNWYEWSYEVAIEIENDSETWEEECHKLMLLQCGLKVLITYADKDISHTKERLDKFLECYKSRKYNRINEEYLFVFLPWSTITESYREIRAYKAFNTCSNNVCVTELKELPAFSF